MFSLTPCFAQQAGGAATEDVFTISVSAPTLAKDVQVRYFLTDNSGRHVSSTSAPGDGNTIVIQAGTKGKSISSFKAIVYAPGCQFVTLNVNDLSSSGRQGEFQCQELPTVPFQGRVSASGLGQKELQVEALYDAQWAHEFFDISSGAVSPISLAKASVDATDGSFTFNLPDFSSDQLYSSLSYHAGLIFFLVDGQSGQRLGRLTSPYDLGHNPHEGFLKVAGTYPAVVEFAVQSPFSR